MSDFVIVSRTQSNLRPPTGSWTRWRAAQPRRKTGHWEGAGGHADHAECPGEWRAIQLYHQTHGYIDIAYHFGVCQHGVIFEGRPASYESAAQRDGNHYSVAVCYIGGPLTPFTDAAKSAFLYLHRKYPGVFIPHCDEPSCATSCAGSVITPWLRALQTAVPHPIVPVPHPAPAPKPLPLPPQGVHHPTLARGAVGLAVRELQVKLNIVAGQGLALDANFGARTDRAVRNFQTVLRLQVDGVAGPKTWGALDWMYAIKTA